MKYRRGTLVRITSGTDWLDDLKSLYSPKEYEIGLIGMVANVELGKDEPIYTIRMSYNPDIKKMDTGVGYYRTVLSEKYLELYKDNDSKSDYDLWMKSQEVINVEAYEKISKSIKNEREVENMNKNIVLMWTQKMKEGYMKTRDKKVSQIKDTDSLLLKKRELEKEMLEILEAAGLNTDDIRPMLVLMQKNKSRIMTQSGVIETLITKETKNAIDEVVKAYNEKINYVDEKSAEVITMIEGCETYEKTIKVLQAYRIVDSEGKLLLSGSFDFE